MSKDQADLGGQALDKIAEVGIFSQLDEVEAIDVDIQTNPLKAFQGEVDSVDIEGKGMVMEKDLRVQEMEMHTGHISINPLSAAFGKIELEHPTEAATRVVLTEGDINRAFNSDYIREKLQNLSVEIEGEPRIVDMQRVEFRLPGDQKLALDAEIALRETSETKQVAFTAVPRMGEGGQRIELADVQHTQGEGLSPDLTDALLDKTRELLDLGNFELEGMSLRLKSLDVQTGQISLQAEAHIQQFPAS